MCPNCDRAGSRCTRFPSSYRTHCSTSLGCGSTTTSGTCIGIAFGTLPCRSRSTSTFAVNGMISPANYRVIPCLLCHDLALRHRYSSVVNKPVSIWQIDNLSH